MKPLIKDVPQIPRATDSFVGSVYSFCAGVLLLLAILSAYALVYDDPDRAFINIEIPSQYIPAPLVMPH